MGLIFSLAYSGRIWSKSVTRLWIGLAVFILITVGIGYWENNLQVWLNVFDSLIAVGIGTLLFVFLFRPNSDMNKAFAFLLVFQVIYSLLRNWLFMSSIYTLTQQMMQTYQTYLKKVPNLNLNADMILGLQQFMLKYQIAIWGSMQVAAAFLGFLLFNRSSALKRPIRFIKLPYVVSYLMLAALVLCFYQPLRILGINCLICMAAVYLIQGTAVLSYYWGDFFTKAKLLGALLVLAVIFNYPMLLLIAFIGLLDVWFDFRKFNRKEEKNESNSN